MDQEINPMVAPELVERQRQVTVRLSDTLWRSLKQVSLARDQTLSETIKRALEASLEERE